LSKTQYVDYGDVGFWAYDVALGIFLKHLVDAAVASDEADTSWLSSAIALWRTAACISDYGLTIDTEWSARQRQTFVVLAEAACERLARRASIPAEEIVSWAILDDLRIFPRGEAEVFTAPVIELGRAIIALISGELPDAPTDRAWFYTLEGRTTVGFRRGV
jgi:hypothetical protein